MTNKPMLSVELRALLERVVKGAPGSTWAALDDDRLAATEELRALLDKPARQVPECVGDLERFEADDGVFVRLGDVIDMLGNEKAAQHQGEPVAELQVAFFEHGSMARINWFTPSAFEPGATKLYAGQPAPVAVVMPDSLNTDEGYSVEAASWYNLALDDVARLNGVKP